MPIPDLSRVDTPVGPLRDKQVLTIDSSGDDLEFPGGVIVAVGTAGKITYRTLHGSVDLAESGLTAGHVLSVGSIPVLVRAVRVDSSDTTVTSIIVGYV